MTGVLVIFAIAALIYLIDLWVDSFLLSVLILLGIGFGILCVIYLGMLITEKVRKLTGTWAFPIDSLKRSCARTGVIDISSEDDFQQAYKMVNNILVQEKIPQRYYDRYLNHSIIAQHYKTMCSDPSWDSSAVMQKVGKCYDECKAAQVESAMTPGQREKAKLIISTYFTNANMDVILKEGCRLRNDEKQREINKVLGAKRKEEQEKLQELTKYANLHGREKRVAMCYADYLLCKQERDNLAASCKNTQSVADNSHRNNSDWAVAGGIAQGIAGPAVGFATALDVQQQEAETRSNNKKLATASVCLLMFQKNELKKMESQLLHHAHLVQKAKTSLVDDNDSNKMFEKLHFSKPEITISQTGTITVKVKTHGEKTTIFDECNAVVDGSVIAHIYEEDTEIGQAIMVLPQNGIGENTCELEGIALFCGKQGGEYHTEFSANDLWAIEK